MDVSKIMIGPWNAYQGGSPPADGSGLEMANGVPTGFTHLGLVDGDLSLKYTPQIVEIKGVQGNGILQVYQSDEDFEVGLNLKQFDRDQLMRLIAGSSFQDAVLSPNQNVFGIGGVNEIPAANLVSWAFVSKIPYQSSDLYFYYLFFKAFVSTGADLSISKEKETVIPVTLKALTDLTRTAGRQIGIYGWETA